MSPTLYLSIEEFEYEGKLLLWVYVPPTSTVEKCINRIYDRNEDGEHGYYRIHLFNYKICITEKATHMQSIRFFHMLLRMIFVLI